LNLQQAIEKGKFREDLFYRLSTVPIYVPPLRERGDDIELLFRKFTTDFSETHRIKPISLTNEAKILLQNQRFPGNIRQLKNLAEQISVLEIGDRIIDDKKLQDYLDFNEPKINSHVIKGDFFQSKEGMNEREILYKILFDLKKDVTELKKLILKVVESGNLNIYDVLHDNMSLFEDIKPMPEEGSRGMALPSYIEDDNQFKFDTKPKKEELEEAQFEEISTISTDVTLSLEKQEKEIIIRALKKNKNKRKYAAQDLGISERTLYRKIKQYDLEDLA
jgi:DNA-binding NtrC family response regulator